jgi:hypothetical protein
MEKRKIAWPFMELDPKFFSHPALIPVAVPTEISKYE